MVGTPKPFNTEVHKMMRDANLLWHYTDWGGLLGIYTNKELWASCARYLNDASEFKVAQKIINDIAGENHSPDFQSALRGLNSDEDIGMDSYVVSLSAAFDDLGQWRGYSGSSPSFAIGFDRDALSEIFQLAGFSLVPCIYDEAEQRIALSEVLNKLVSIRPTMEPNFAAMNAPSHVRQRAIANFERVARADILRLVARIKDSSFAAEQEHRLISGPLGSVQDSIARGYRIRGGLVVPYVKVPLKRNRDGECPLPISAILVGPTPHPVLNVEAVRKLVTADRDKIKVAHTAIPFRNW